jgi:hypothetical protein
MLGIAQRARAVFFVLACACTPTLTPPELPPAPEEAQRTQQFYLLLYPEADAESLLGRAVQATAQGSFTVADERAPGCRVEPELQKASFRVRRQVGAEAVTAVAAGYAQLVSLQSKFGRSSAADLQIDNKSVLRGRIGGACGGLVIDRVFVGTGARRMVALAGDEAEGGVNLGVVSAESTVRAARRVIDEIEWQDEQGYAFSFRQFTDEEPLDLRVSLPVSLTEGQELEIRFEARRRAWLVVYALDETGAASVLWPSDEEPEPQVTPEAPAILPSLRERAQGFKLRAALIDAKRRSRETLVVYAFSDVRDFRALRPEPGSSRRDGPAFAAELTQRLQGIPLTQWSRSVTEYVVLPR